MNFISVIKKNCYVILLIFLSLFFLLCIYNNKVIEENYLRITVNYGDTVWMIADEFESFHEYSHMDFIKRVEKLNNIDASLITPGQELVIPIQKKVLYIASAKRDQ